MAPPKRVAATPQLKSKRARVDEEPPSSFVTQLASLAPSASDSSIASASGADSAKGREWSRPSLPPNLGNDNKAEISVQVVDIDYFTDEKGDVVVRLFGATMEENSVCVHVRGFVPYFFVQVDSAFGPEHLDKARKTLNDLVKANGGGSGTGIPKFVENFVTDVEIVNSSNLYGYREETKKFLKVFVCSPRLLPVCRRVLQPDIDLFGNGRAHLMCFEANIDFEIRFMVDIGLVGCGWVSLPAGSYTLVQKKLSRCQLECSIACKDLVVHSPESSPEWSAVAPLRILSFDIECVNRRGIFPEAHTDAIIQIANMVKVEGESEPFIRNCFVIGETAEVIGSDIIVCKTETELLEKWAAFVRTVDPDLITGYNIQNFDFPYIIERAKTLAIESNVTMLGRVLNTLSKFREMPMSSRQMGNRSNKITNVEGRVVFDVIQVILRDYKLRSYSLNSVSYHFLGEQKEDVDYTIIVDLQNGNALSRRRLAVYCMKDAYLPLRLLQQLMSVINYVEMARVTGVPLDFLLSRGQQVKVLSQLLRKAKTRNFLLPVIEAAQTDDTYEGATVIEPLRGFYDEPIATLDFASLYPSIMIAHNLCYTTLLQGQNPSVKEDDFEVSPSNNRFVKAHLRRGLLPEILEDLLSARKRAKTDLKNEKDPFRRMVLNGRQLALKISANSVYGFTGATVGKLPCLEISQSVTAYGRQMIELTKKTVEEIYKKGSLDGKCSIDAQVVYGDTDSVMVKFGVKDVAVAMEVGMHAATEVSKKFRPPIRLEFEKVYFPFLLINKKRYAGLYFTRPEKHDKMDCKGLETVRRDNCPLVSKVLNACLEKMLLDHDATGALEHAKKIISDLLCNRIDISELIITKELTRASSAYAAKQAHVVLAERMRERDPGSAPRLGDRVPYVIVAKGKKVAAYEKAEDPIYVLENNIPIDTSYYLENQLAKPLARIFEPVLGDRAESMLTGGSHTFVRSVPQSKVGALSSFVQRSERCLVCKAGLPAHVRDPTCANCRPLVGQTYIKHVALMNATEDRFARLWTECQNCAGTVMEEVLCTSRDCPIFYMREKVRVDLSDQYKALSRFNLSTW